jgi:hypothetical protein
MLGYRSYHMAEIAQRGPTHMKLFEEAVRLKMYGGGKLYGKAEFDKWFADYDVGSPPHEACNVVLSLALLTATSRP